MPLIPIKMRLMLVRSPLEANRYTMPTVCAPSSNDTALCCLWLPSFC